MTVPPVYRYDPTRDDDLTPRPGFTAIYGLFDPRDGELRYVGKSVDPWKRFRGHAFSNKDLHGRTYRAHWLLGLVESGDWPHIQILEWASNDVWADVERAHIQAARDAGCRLTNLTVGGEGCLGRPLSPQTRAKISASLMGHGVSPETMHALHAGNLAYAFTDADKLARSHALLGRSRSDETKEKIRQTLQGHDCDEQTREKSKNRPHRTMINGQVRCTVVTEDTVRAIRADYATGQFSLSMLAQKYPTSRSNIANIVARTTWVHIE